MKLCVTQLHNKQIIHAAAALIIYFHNKTVYKTLHRNNCGAFDYF